MKYTKNGILPFGIVGLLLLPFSLFAQNEKIVKVMLQLAPKQAANQSIFLAGNVNSWNPSDSAFRFNNQRELEILVPQNETIDFKLTRGSWEKVETKANGENIENRTFKAATDTTITLQVEAWKDFFGPPPPKKHTASVNVGVLDSAFFIPQLKRYRTVRIYLPPDYKTSGRRYPVLYMADGQNCFDEFTSGFGEWKVDEALDHFYDSCKKSMIVVAVDHGGKYRNQEYDPYDFKEIGKGEGGLYVRFVKETLKPFVDKRLRTLADKNHTYIAGSSMGGVISMWALLAYPNVFGNAGVFSPAFWTARPMFDYAKKQLPLLKGNTIFFYAGGKESETMVPYTKEMYQVLSGSKTVRTQLFVDENAQHNEAAWAKWFPVYLQWLNK